MPFHFPGVPCEVVYCPVEPLRLSPEFDRTALRGRFETASDAVVVIQVGRWESHKGHVTHIEALGRLKDIPNWVCWQVGAPQRPIEKAYQDEIRAAAEREGVAERVRFLGWQSELGDLLASSDIYCQPNVRPEPFGISLVEALYSGLPVVASAAGGPIEIIDKTCGVLTAPGNSEAVATALRELIADPGRRRHLGAVGPQRARYLCDPAQQVERLASIVCPISK